MTGTRDLAIAMKASKKRKNDKRDTIPHLMGDCGHCGSLLDASESGKGDALAIAGDEKGDHIINPISPVGVRSSEKSQVTLTGCDDVRLFRWRSSVIAFEVIVHRQPCPSHLNRPVMLGDRENKRDTNTHFLRNDDGLAMSVNWISKSVSPQKQPIQSVVHGQS